MSYTFWYTNLMCFMQFCLQNPWRDVRNYTIDLPTYLTSTFIANSLVYIVWNWLFFPVTYRSTNKITSSIGISIYVSSLFQWHSEVHSWLHFKKEPASYPMLISWFKKNDLERLKQNNSMLILIDLVKIGIIWTVMYLRPGGGGGGGYSPNMVNGGVPLKWVTFFQKNP